MTNFQFSIFFLRGILTTSAGAVQTQAAETTGALPAGVVEFAGQVARNHSAGTTGPSAFKPGR
jgi:hypothetical protein